MTQDKRRYVADAGELLRANVKRIRLLIVFAVAALGAAAALADAQPDAWILYEPAAVEWRAAESLPPGAQIAVLDGDPSREGLFTMRIRMPDGYRVPPHWHSQQERVTVLSGMLNLGHGESFDAKVAKALPPGTFSSMPPGMRHFAWMTGETILQLSSTGPWTIMYVNRADDPRNAGR